MAKTLLFLVLVLLIILYVQYYTKYNNDYKIIQSTLGNLEGKVLYERYPIVISDRLVNPDDILKTLFKYTYLTEKRAVIEGSFNVCRVFNKYTIIYSPHEDIDMNLIVPSYSKEFAPWHMHTSQCMFVSKGHSLTDSNAQYITIKLKKQQVLILPPYWMYHSINIYRIIALNDPISSLINLRNVWST